MIGLASLASAQTIGVVLMHGNTGSRSGNIALLAAAMEGAVVEQPEMCWSYRRKRDQPFLNCLAELEAPIARLTGRGVRAIGVAGMSQGGIAALALGARRPGLAGIIALAPSGAPERLVTVFPQIAQSVAQGAWLQSPLAGRGRDLPLPDQVRSAILVSKPPGIWRMPAEGLVGSTADAYCRGAGA